MNKQDGTISGFFGRYRFLSNFYPSDMIFRGIPHQSSEAAYQAQKSDNPEVQKQFSHLTARQAKSFGKRILLRSDWEQIKDAVMWEVLLAKFESSLDLTVRLCDTGNVILIEGNSWGDRYWGVCGGVGENRLGTLLMELRNWYQGKPVHHDRKLLRSLAYYNL